VALVAALVTVVLWASAFVGIRAAGEDLSPGALSLGRLAVGSALLGVFVLLQRGRLPSRRDWPGIVVCGVLWFGLYNLALNEAEQRVDAGTAAMLVNIGPILIALLAGFLLGEGFPARARRRLRGRVPRRRGHRGRHLGAGGAASWGAILCVAAAAFYAGGVVAQKPLLSRLSGLHSHGRRARSACSYASRSHRRWSTSLAAPTGARWPGWSTSARSPPGSAS
jgi:drug/metabolite transporter (DMT)-like permease